MGFSEAIQTVLKQKYATFSGRAPRSEYWWFSLFYFLVMMVLVVILLVLGANDMSTTGEVPVSAMIVFGLIGIFILASVLPLIAVTIRRLHDRNLSGWWYLGAIVLSAVPFVGWLASIALLVVCALPGTPGANRFGADPLNLSSADVFR